MRRKLVARLMLAVTPAVIVCCLLTSGAFAAAQSGVDPCSNRTIVGDYGGASEGVLLGIPGLPPEAQFRGLTMTHFDGKGNLTWVEHTVINGVPVQAGWIAASGTYAVNPDCTGTAVVNTPNSPVPLVLPFVVVRRGKEIRTVLDSDAIASVFTRVK
jgi:hypothetical protein